MAPENCDCSGMDAVIKAHNDLVEAGQMTVDSAICSFREIVDLSCGGKKEKPRETGAITGCGVPELICGHCKGADFMIKAAVGLRKSL